MKIKPTHLLIAVALCVVAAITVFISAKYKAIAQKDDDRSARSSQPVREVNADRQKATAERVEEMLKGSGITFDRSSIDGGQRNASKVYHLRLETNGISGQLESARPSVNSLRIESKPLARQGAIRQQRSFELSEFDIVVFAVNSADKVVWWEIKPDPRVVRAETSDADGRLHGSTLYRQSPDLLVAVPADRSIERLYLFSPVWDGNRFSLEGLGSIKVEGNQDEK